MRTLLNDQEMMEPVIKSEISDDNLDYVENFILEDPLDVKEEKEDYNDNQMEKNLLEMESDTWENPYQDLNIFKIKIETTEDEEASQNLVDCESTTFKTLNSTSNCFDTWNKSLNNGLEELYPSPSFSSSVKKRGKIIRSYSSSASKTKDKSNAYACFYCEYTTKYLSAIKVHVAAHSDERPYKCSKCHFSSKYPSSLISHKKRNICHTRRKYKRRDNKKKTEFSSSIESSCLSVNLKQLSNKKTYMCIQCGVSFANIVLLVAHENTCKSQLENESEEVANCSVSPILKKQDKEIMQELSLTNTETFQKSRVQKRNKDRQTGTKTENLTKKKKFKCKKCTLATTKLCSLKLHEVVHTTERLYKCHKCNTSSFQYKCNLKIHEENYCLHREMKNSKIKKIREINKKWFTDGNWSDEADSLGLKTTLVNDSNSLNRNLRKRQNQQIIEICDLDDKNLTIHSSKRTKIKEEDISLVDKTISDEYLACHSRTSNYSSELDLPENNHINFKNAEAFDSVTSNSIRKKNKRVEVTTDSDEDQESTTLIAKNNSEDESSFLNIPDTNLQEIRNSYTDIKEPEEATSEPNNIEDLKNKLLCSSKCDYTSSSSSHLNFHEASHSGIKRYKCVKCNFCTKYKSKYIQHQCIKTCGSGNKCEENLKQIKRTRIDIPSGNCVTKDNNGIDRETPFSNECCLRSIRKNDRVELIQISTDLDKDLETGYIIAKHNSEEIERKNTLSPINKTSYNSFSLTTKDKFLSNDNDDDFDGYNKSSYNIDDDLDYERRDDDKISFNRISLKAKSKFSSNNSDNNDFILNIEDLNDYERDETSVLKTKKERKKLKRKKRLRGMNSHSHDVDYKLYYQTDHLSKKRVSKRIKTKSASLNQNRSKNAIDSIDERSYKSESENNADDENTSQQSSESKGSEECNYYNSDESSNSSKEIEKENDILFNFFDGSEHKYDDEALLQIVFQKPKVFLKKLKLHYCTNCDFISQSSHKLETHKLETHIKSKKYYCSECNYYAVSKGALILHKRMHRHKNILSSKNKISDFECEEVERSEENSGYTNGDSEKESGVCPVVSNTSMISEIKNDEVQACPSISNISVISMRKNHNDDCCSTQVPCENIPVSNTGALGVSEGIYANSCNSPVHHKNIPATNTLISIEKKYDDCPSSLTDEKTKMKTDKIKTLLSSNLDSKNHCNIIENVRSNKKVETDDLTLIKEHINKIVNERVTSILTDVLGLNLKQQWLENSSSESSVEICQSEQEIEKTVDKTSHEYLFEAVNLYQKSLGVSDDPQSDSYKAPTEDYLTTEENSEFSQEVFSKLGNYLEPNFFNDYIKDKLKDDITSQGNVREPPSITFNESYTNPYRIQTCKLKDLNVSQKVVGKIKKYFEGTNDDVKIKNKNSDNITTQLTIEKFCESYVRNKSSNPNWNTTEQDKSITNYDSQLKFPVKFNISDSELNTHSKIDTDSSKQSLNATISSKTRNIRSKSFFFRRYREKL